MTKDWKQKLSRQLVVVGKQPRVLTTLNEAGLFLIEQVHIRGETEDLRYAMMQLLAAAVSRDPADIADATDELEAVLRAHRMH